MSRSPIESLSLTVSGSLLGHDNMINQDLAGRVTSYSQVIAADGGYDTATIEFQADINEQQRWFSEALGMHVETRNPRLDVIWEGFVNEVSITYGNLVVVHGPLLDIANKVYVKYKSDTTEKGAVTAAGEDTDSQNKYGIFTEIQVMSDATLTMAEALRGRHLNETKSPIVTHDVGQQSDPSVSFSCAGYGRMLGIFPYTKAAGSWTLREKIIDVLASEPNGTFSTDYTKIAANGLSVLKEEADWRMGMDVISDLVDLGGEANDNKHVFGIYTNRRAQYNEIPSVVEYTSDALTTTSAVLDANSNPVDPGLVLPGKWCFFTDFLPGMQKKSNLREDPRALFIKAVTFTAPHEVSFASEETGEMPQILAKLAGSG